MVKIFTDLLHGIEPNNIKLNQMMELIEFLLEDSKTDPKHKSESNLTAESQDGSIDDCFKIFLNLSLAFSPHAALN